MLNKTQEMRPGPNVEFRTINKVGTRLSLVGRSFYFLMSLLIAVVVVYGFSHTINARLIHPPSPRPFILYVHAAIFTGWIVFFILQSTLIRMRNARLHRQLGWFGLVLGMAIPPIGIATAITMTRLRMREGRADAAQFLIVPMFDMLAFSLTFGLAFCWQRRPEIHRRLMLIATCSLTAAAFERFPDVVMPHNWFYAGVDALVLFGGMRDLLAVKRVHPGVPLRTPSVDAGPSGSDLRVCAQLAGVAGHRPCSARLAAIAYSNSYLPLHSAATMCYSYFPPRGASFRLEAALANVIRLRK